MKGHRMSSRTHRVIALLIGISLGWSGLTPHQLSAQPTPTPTLPTKDRGLFFSTGTPGEFYEAPMLKTDVEVQVHGTMLHATVRQQFMNPSKKWLEGIYLFPLPERSAVERLRMQVGDRVIEGEIQEKEAAKQTYERAKLVGKRASLVSSARPNLFTTRVANIGPGQHVSIELQFQDVIHRQQHDGHEQYSFRFPMVVAPRHVPGPLTNQTVDDSGNAVPGKWSTPAVPDAGALFSPLHLPTEKKPQINPVSFTIQLDAGFETGTITSLYHPIAIQPASARQHTIRLRNGVVPATRDFVLEWEPKQALNRPATLFTEQIGADTYLHGTIYPPAVKPQPTAAPPRELVMVIDVSGSMAGTSLSQVKAAIPVMLQRLRPRDRFNLITFADDKLSLFDTSQPASATNLEQARQFVQYLLADGGTNMLPALTTALKNPAHPDARDTSTEARTTASSTYFKHFVKLLEANGSTEILPSPTLALNSPAYTDDLGTSAEARTTPSSTYFKQIVVLTDGAVGNEEEILSLIAKQLGSQRLFTVGIGSAPNAHFMRTVAERGRGTFTYIGSVSEVTDKMVALFQKLESPTVTNIVLHWPGQITNHAITVYPSTIPDVYAGDPVTFTARLANRDQHSIQGTLTMTGHAGEQVWQQTIPLAEVPASPGVSKIWARRKISELMSGSHERAEVVQVALRHHLVTRYTSLVAVDHHQARPPEEQVTPHELATNLPDGWDVQRWMSKLLGAKQQQVQNAPVPLHKAPVPNGQIQQPTPAPPAAMHRVALALPQTATGAPQHLMIGVMLFLLTLGCYTLMQRQRACIPNAPITRGRRS